MIRKRWVGVSLLALSSAACFHQVVNTGRTAGTTTVEKQWVTTWLWGLVPAQPIDVRAQCPSGVAVITTEQSFVNGLAAVVTLGIFTPQHVTVTCASGTAMLPSGAHELRIPADASADERAALVGDAIRETVETSSPTILRF
jgi:hypothetical protein